MMTTKIQSTTVYQRQQREQRPTADVTVFPFNGMISGVTPGGCFDSSRITATISSQMRKIMFVRKLLAPCLARQPRASGVESAKIPDASIIQLVVQTGYSKA
eukprot:TRINITY_DN10204_c0_g1_i2.p4 TRINITY_DN10204_c0_g1~~TRINITY_DN10204_c0_g1_i2.p4  ORF type:complete len:102 (-),score=8.81 TRINITY_DN10204_c0_g1_i2:225-530(-)